METSGPLISVGIVSLGACAITEPERGFPAGGSEVQLYLIARALAAQKDFRVTLHVADLGQAERVENGVRIRPLVPVKPDFGISLGAAFRSIGRLAHERHALYVTRSASAITGMVRVASWLAGGTHLHMCAHDDECAGAADSTLSRPAKRLHGFGLRHADAVACQTAKQLELLKTAFGIAGVLAPNLPPNLHPSEADQPRDGVLWVGRDVDWKGPELFIELARRLPECFFTMVCQPQPGRDLARLAKLAPGNLRLIPGLPIQEAAALFDRHRVYAMTSRAEGFPNVVLQAAGAGTPIVSLCVDPDGLLSSNRAGFVCHGSFEELVRRTIELLTNPALWDEAHEGALRLSRRVAAAGDRVVGLARSLAVSGERRRGSKMDR